MYIRIYRNFAFLANIGHISVGYRHDRPTMCGKLNAHQRGIDPALISGGLGVEARILVVQWLLYLFTYLTNVVAIPQPWWVLPYCDGSTHHLAANESSN